MSMLNKFYRELLDKHGANSYRTLSWISPATQAIRFAQLVKIIANQQDKFTLLDVGCGFADLYSYLKETGFHNIDYSGIDLMPEFIDADKKAHPNIQLIEGDFLEIDFNQRYDYIVSSGTLNVIVDPSQPPYEHAFSVIDKMFELANCGIAFNMLWEKGKMISRPMRASFILT